MEIKKSISTGFFRDLSPEECVKELAAAADRETMRQYGDIITSNLHMMKRGMTLLKAANFYDPDYREVEIPLDPLKTP